MNKNELSFGTLTTTWSGTYMIDSTYTTPGTTDEWVSSMGRFGDNDAVSFRLVSQIQTVLEHDDFAHSLSFNYKSGYQDQYQDAAGCSVTLVDALGDCVATQLHISSYVKVDYQTRYHIDDDLSVALGVNNLLDRAPDFSLRTSGAGHQVGFDPRYADPYGRTIYLTGEYKF